MGIDVVECETIVCKKFKWFILLSSSEWFKLITLIKLSLVFISIKLYTLQIECKNSCAETA